MAFGALGWSWANGAHSDRARLRLVPEPVHLYGSMDPSDDPDPHTDYDAEAEWREKYGITADGGGWASGTCSDGAKAEVWPWHDSPSWPGASSLTPGQDDQPGAGGSPSSFPPDDAPTREPGAGAESPLPAPAPEPWPPPARPADTAETFRAPLFADCLTFMQDQDAYALAVCDGYDYQRRAYMTRLRASLA